MLSGSWRITRPGPILQNIAIPSRSGSRPRDPETLMSIAEKFVAMEHGPAPEDSKDAQAWLVHHQRRFGHFVQWAWLQPSDRQCFGTRDPSHGEQLAC